MSTKQRENIEQRLAILEQRRQALRGDLDLESLNEKIDLNTEMMKLDLENLNVKIGLNTEMMKLALDLFHLGLPEMNETQETQETQETEEESIEIILKEEGKNDEHS